MELDLKYRGKTWHYSDISLKDFFIPVVDSTELDFQIEPAIWFKSLIIKSVVIDCDVRNIFWESVDKQAHQRIVFEDNRLEESELFVSAISLTQICDTKQCAKEILRILHLHVLPAIVLRKVDQPPLILALETVEDAISSVNKLTVQTDKDISKSESDLKEMRDLLIANDDFEHKKFLKHCNENFLARFLEDINREIRAMTDKLLTFPSVTEMTSTEKLHRDTDPSKSAWKKRRDELQTAILRFQRVQGTIKAFLNKKKKKSKKSKTEYREDHEAYVALKRKIADDKSFMGSLLERKVKVTSVREAITQAISDLKASGESTGLYVTSFGEPSPTDILGNKTTKPKKWITLNERIQSILNDTMNDISKNFQLFYKTTTRKIEGFLSEQAMIERKKEENVPFFMPLSEYTLPPRKAKQVPKGNDYANISADQDLNSPFKRFSQLIKGEVMQHTYDQCQLLVKTLSKQSPNKKVNGSKISLNNTWVFYELQLYQQLIHPLCDLYEYIHKDKAKELMGFLVGKTPVDLGVVEPWLVCRDDTRHNIGTNKHYQENVAIVARKSGEARAIADIYESDDELKEFFDNSVDSDYFSSCETINTIDQVEVKQSKCQERFIPVNNEIKNMLRSRSVMGKLKNIGKVSRMVSDCASSLKAEYCGCQDDDAINAEDMLASIICVLTFLEGPTFEKLYSHVHLVNDFIPPFMMGSVQDWALTNFYCAFQNIVSNMESLAPENEQPLNVKL